MGSVQRQKDCVRCGHADAVTSDAQFRTGEYNEFCDVCGWLFDYTLNNRDALIEGTEKEYKYDFRLIGPRGIVEFRYENEVSALGVYESDEALDKFKKEAQAFVVEHPGAKCLFTFFEDGVWMEEEVSTGSRKPRKSRMERMA